MKRYNADSQKWSKRCGHPWCSNCRTRRGRNIGNRRERHMIRMLLRKV